MTTTPPTIKGFAWDVSKATHVVNPALNMSGAAISPGDWMVLVWSYQAGSSLRPPVLAAPWRERVAPVGFGTMGWALWSGIRGAADTTYAIPTTVGNTNTPNWMLVWGSGPGPSEDAWVQGATGSRAGQPTQFEATAPSIAAPEGSLVLVVGSERTGGVETLGTIVPDNGFTSYAFANPTTSTPYVAYKSYPAGGATGNTKVVWPFSHASNAQILQLAIPGVLSPVKPLGPSGVKFWDSVSGQWISLARGPQGTQGAQGAAGAAASERSPSLAHRSLGVGQSLGQGWTDVAINTTPGASEVNSPIEIVSGHIFKFKTTGAYFMTIRSSTSAAATGRWIIRLTRVTDNFDWAQQCWGIGNSGCTFNAVVLARAGEHWGISFWRADGGVVTHGSHMYVAPIGPCRVYDYVP